MSEDAINYRRAILINGIKEPNLKAYFIREYKKAERDNFYTVDDFFNPLFDLIDTWGKEIATKFYNAKKSLTERIERAKRNEPDRLIFEHFYGFCKEREMSFEDFTKQENNKRLESLTKEQKELTIDNYRIKHRTFTKPELTLPELTLLEDAIKLAMTDFNKNIKKPVETSFENKFDIVPAVKVHEHFKNGLVDKHYLTEEELNEYLKLAFELKTVPKTRFNFKNAPRRKNIHEVFYTYYRTVAGKTHGQQTEYASLLGEYFQGYKTSTVSSNFSKSVY